MKTRTGKRRNPEKEQYWRRAIADQIRSGLSVRTFCEREGLEPWNFHWWRQALSRRDREVASARTVPPTDSTNELPAPSAILPVHVVQDGADTIATSTPIEIVLPEGLTVRVARGFDPVALHTLLSVLEARRC
jgi:hypothetical protein